MAACSSHKGGSSPVKTTPDASAARASQPRAKLAAAIQPLLPKRGLYAAGGGFMSTPWRIVVELDDHGTATLRAGKGTQRGGSSDGPMTETTRQLDAATTADVMDCGNRAWREKREPNLHPIADYDEVLAVLDGDDTFWLEGFGPIRGGAAEQCIAKLSTLAK
jgi:hypothetical protein